MRDLWTLEVSSEDWRRRDEGSKRDLAATLYSSFIGVRAQAGGDPADAVLLIVNESDEKLVMVSDEGGIEVYR
jgi:hypothetical protein